MLNIEKYKIEEFEVVLICTKCSSSMIFSSTEQINPAVPEKYIHRCTNVYCGHIQTLDKEYPYNEKIKTKQ